jgi:hypothetical protein
VIGKDVVSGSAGEDCAGGFAESYCGCALPVVCCETSLRV